MFFYVFLFFFSKIFSVQEANKNLTGQLFANSPLKDESLLFYKKKKVIEKFFFGGSVLFFLGALVLKKKSVQYWRIPFISSFPFLGFAVFLKKNNNEIDDYIKNSLIVMNYAYQEFLKKFDCTDGKQNRYAELIDFMIPDNGRINIILKFYCDNKKMVFLEDIAEEAYNKACLKIDKNINIENIMQKVFNINGSKFNTRKSINKLKNKIEVYEEPKELSTGIKLEERNE